MASVIFCLKCGSDLIDVCGWTDDGSAAQMRCCTCGHEQRLEGFTVARLGPTIGYARAEQIAEAAVEDIALFHGQPGAERRLRERYHARTASRGRR